MRSAMQVLFLFSPFYKFWETNRIILREMVTNLGGALLGVAIISSIILVSPFAVITIVGCILITDMMLFAEMWIFGIELNTVSVVNVIMAVGLSVDYSVHVLHTFLCKHGSSRQDRSNKAMLDIGAAVLLGMLSTLLGIVILAGSSSEIIRIFFKLMMGTVCFGGFVGMIFLPVFLALLGPRPVLATGSTAADGSAAVKNPQGA
jgi:predicted RND superfamily exporter protein